MSDIVPTEPTAKINQPVLARTIAVRRRSGSMMIVLIYVASALALLPLILILGHIVVRGFSALSAGFFIHLPAPAGVSGGGMANGIGGTMLLIGIASLVSLPIGLGAGLFLVERRGSRLANIVRFLADVLNGLPSIVLGVVAWELLVRPVGHFSALAGGLTLGVLMIPLVTRATEEMVRLVPVALSEAALALGFSEFRTAFVVVVRTALPGIITGALVAMARIAGETAPLLFTALGNAYWSWDLSKPIAALPLQVYAFALSPYDDWRAQAWTGALVLVLIVLVIGLLSRVAVRSRQRLSGAATVSGSSRV
ncbi:MAG: phosphate ABC transporter permease PstA [Gemmatimonadaceae bacterium]